MADLNEISVVLRVIARDEAQGAIASVRTGLKQLADQGTSTSDALKTIASGLAFGTGVAAGLAALDGVGNAMKGVVTEGIAMNAMMETSQLQFKTLMGSADEAQSHVAELFDIAKKTPFTFEGITEASRSLEVFGGGALDTKANLLALGDAAAATGAPIQEVTFWTGRLYAELQGGRPIGESARWLQQLAILSPQVRNQLEDMQKAGKSGNEIWAVYSQSLQKFSGAMEEQSHTWAGLTSTMGDSLKLLAGDALGASFKVLEDDLKGLNDTLGDPKTVQGAKDLGAAFGEIARGASTVAQGILLIDGALVTVAGDIGQFESKFSELGNLLKAFEAGPRAIGDSFDALGNHIGAALSKAESGDIKGMGHEVAAGFAEADETFKKVDKSASDLAETHRETAAAATAHAEATARLGSAADDTAKRIDAETKAVAEARKALGETGNAMAKAIEDQHSYSREVVKTAEQVKAASDAEATVRNANLDKQKSALEGWKSKELDAAKVTHDSVVQSVDDEATRYDRAAQKQVQAAQDAKEAKVAAAQAAHDATIATITDQENKARDASEKDIHGYEATAKAQITAIEATREAQLNALTKQQQAAQDARTAEDRALSDQRTREDRADAAAHAAKLAHLKAEQTAQEGTIKAEQAATESALKATLEGFADQEQAARATSEGVIKGLTAQQQAEKQRHDAALADYQREEDAALRPLQAQLAALDRLKAAQQNAATDRGNQQALTQAQQGVATARQSGDPQAVARAEQALQDAQDRVRQAAADRRDAAERAAIQQRMAGVQAEAAAKKAAEDAQTQATAERIQKEQQAEKDRLATVLAGISTQKDAAQQAADGEKATLAAQLQQVQTYWAGRITAENAAYQKSQQALGDSRTAFDRDLADRRKEEDRQFALTQQGIRDTATKAIAAANATKDAETIARRDALTATTRDLTAQRTAAEEAYKAESKAAEDTFKADSRNIETAKQSAHDAFDQRKRDAEAAYTQEQKNIAATFGTGDPNGSGFLDKIEKAKQDNKAGLGEQEKDYAHWSAVAGKAIDDVAAKMTALNGQAAAFHGPGGPGGDPGGALPGGGAAGANAPLTEAEFGNQDLQRSFEANGLTADEVAAACGPIMLAGILKAAGQAADPAKLTAEAKKQGWWSATQGTTDIGALAAAHGIGLGQTDYAGVQGALQQGNLAAIDVGPTATFPGHFLLGQGVNQQGQIDFGNTGTALKGGSRYMTLADVTRLTGSSSFRYFTASRQGAAVKQPSQSQGQIGDYIRARAAALGYVNPDIAVVVAESEGGVTEWAHPGDWDTSKDGQRVPTSFGPFQLHYGAEHTGATGAQAVGGLGDDFTAETGLDAADPANGPAAALWALEYAKGHGWGPWHGWKGDPQAGITKMATGGWIDEPVLGVGQQSGKAYSLGEQGPERVLSAKDAREWLSLDPKDLYSIYQDTKAYAKQAYDAAAKAHDAAGEHAAIARVNAAHDLYQKRSDFDREHLVYDAVKAAQPTLNELYREAVQQGNVKAAAGIRSEWRDLLAANVQHNAATGTEALGVLADLGYDWRGDQLVSPWAAAPGGPQAFFGLPAPTGKVRPGMGVGPSDASGGTPSAPRTVEQHFHAPVSIHPQTTLDSWTELALLVGTT